MGFCFCPCYLDRLWVSLIAVLLSSVLTRKIGGMCNAIGEDLTYWDQTNMK